MLQNFLKTVIIHDFRLPGWVWLDYEALGGPSRAVRAHVELEMALALMSTLLSRLAGTVYHLQPAPLVTRGSNPMGQVNYTLAVCLAG